MAEQSQVCVALLPDGRVVAPEVGADVIDAGATRERLGCVRDNGQQMAFVRAEIGGTSWTSLVNQDSLDQHDPLLVVTLRRQSGDALASLNGWILFC